MARKNTVSPDKPAGGKPPESKAKKTRKPASGPGPREVRVRMYRHGLGDCFLLSFPRNSPGSAAPFTVLIDCGIIPGTPQGDDKIREVVADLKKTTGGKIDVLVATHEHADHVSGFDPKGHLFDDFTFGKVWLAWTEDPEDKVAVGIRAERQKKLNALWLGFHQLHERLTAMGADVDSMENLDRAFEVLSFFGITRHDEPPSSGFGADAKPPAKGATARAMDWVREGAKPGAKARYWKPGECAALDDEVEGTRVFVLGPPQDLRLLHKDLPSSGKANPVETYEDEEDENKKVTPRRTRTGPPSRPDAAERAFFASAFGADAAAFLPDQPGQGLPFDRKYRIEWDDAPKVEFFDDHYFGDDRSQDWRRIDADWAEGGASFALQLDGDTNNTSLALAFELPGGHVLLFPGDAQVGNWESWHADSDGKELAFVDAANGRKVTAESLLNRVVLYKVGHHGSHNATLRDKGLEMMTRPGLSALVPVDAYVAHVKKRWTKMPFNPLMRRLGEKILEGKVVRADVAVDGRDGIAAVQGLPARFEDAKAPFTVLFEVEGREEPVSRPLFVDYVLDLDGR